MLNLHKGKYRIFGDTHARMHDYLRNLKTCERSIHLGDFGVGFMTGDTFERVEQALMFKNHYFIRGNHDHPEGCKKWDNWIPDGHYAEEIDTFFIGGALSIDKEWRTHGVDWWANEEVNYTDFCEMMDRYSELKPSVMITHDSPRSTRPLLGANVRIKSLTDYALECMLEEHKPDRWFFGHWHMDYSFQHKGVEFRCVDIDSYVDVDL